MKNAYLKKLSGALVAVSFAFVAVTSQAATIILDANGTTVTGINNLEVITGIGPSATSEFYDVTFLNTLGEDLYGPAGGSTFQFADSIEAEAASSAVTDFLNLYNTDNDPDADTVGDPDAGLLNSQFWIGYGERVPTGISPCAPADTCIETAHGSWTPSDVWKTEGQIEFLAFDEPRIYASFQPVPVPAAAWLFGSALIGLAGIKRKK
jgi:hypothetical protein